ncbi:MAG: sigma-70 family RNA polymerase sigma factor [Vicinamibacterales bacterium]
MTRDDGVRAAPRPDPDAVDVQRARKGDAGAFDALVRRHQDRLVNYLAAFLGNAADAEDVAQEAFVRAYRALRQFRGQSAFKTWLFQIATNAARTHRARRVSRREVSTEPVDAEAPVREVESHEDLESRVVLRDRLDRALRALPDDQREAVILRDVEGFDYREIADLLDVPMGTVESRIFRGRQKLRLLLATPLESVEERTS